MTKISVIIPARNAAMTIGKTLLSLYSEKQVIGEVIVVDDGSSDSTVKQAYHYGAHLKLNLVVHSVSYLSAAAARNHGIVNAQYPYIYFIDADDQLIAGGLLLLLKHMSENADTGIVIGGSIRVTPGHKELRRIPLGYSSNPISNAELYLSNGSPPIAIGCGLVRTDIAAKVLFPEKIKLDEDTWFWSAVLAQANVNTIKDPIVRYNLDEQRTARRFTDSPTTQWLNIASTFGKLADLGVSRDILRSRKAWLAQRFSRQLIKQKRFKEALSILRPVLKHPKYRREIRTIKYHAFCRIGMALGLSKNCANKKVDPSHDQRTMIITHDPAYPTISGADLRNYQNAKFAKRLGAVAIVSIRESDVRNSPEEIRLHSLSKKNDPKTRSVNRSRLPHEPRLSILMIERLCDFIDEFKPTSIILEGIYLHSLVQQLKLSKAQIILDMHNVESDLIKQFQNLTHPSFLTGLGSWKLSNAERKTIKSVDQVWVCTENDRTRLIEEYGLGTEISVVPNSIPMRDSITIRKLRDVGDAPKLLFVGHLGYLPNVIAVERLAHSIKPMLSKYFPNVTLQIVGRYPNKRVRALNKLPNVQVVENPQSVEEFLQSADVSVIPLTYGGGSRIKILEAADCGIPIVATAKAAEGLEFLPDTEIMIADTDAEIVASCVELLNSTEKRQSVRGAARITAQNLYSHKQIAHLFELALRPDVTAATKTKME